MRFRKVSQVELSFKQIPLHVLDGNSTTNALDRIVFSILNRNVSYRMIRVHHIKKGTIAEELYSYLRSKDFLSDGNDLVPYLDETHDHMYNPFNKKYEGIDLESEPDDSYTTYYSSLTFNEILTFTRSFIFSS